MDVYNSLIVLVANSNFSHNVVWNVSKEDTYRGYAAGLSVGKISIQRYRKPWFAATAAYMAQRALGLEGVARLLIQLLILFPNLHVLVQAGDT